MKVSDDAIYDLYYDALQHKIVINIIFCELSLSFSGSSENIIALL